MALEQEWVLTSIALTTASLFFVTAKFILSTLRAKDFPPGPAALPCIGNVHQIPAKQPFLKFTEWSKKYGKIIGLKIGSGNLVILNDPHYVHELFGKRGSIYSGRKFGYIITKTIMKEQEGVHLLSLNPGSYLRKWRTFATDFANTQGQKNTRPIQVATSATLVFNLLDSTPGTNLEHLKFWALATSLLAITGQRLEDRGKAFRDRFFLSQEKWLTLLEPGNAPPVDLFPVLRWIPETFAKWKKDAKYVRAYYEEEYSSFLQTAKGFLNGRSSVATDCFMTKVLDHEMHNDDNVKFDDTSVAWFGGNLLDAAVDTTWATMNSFILFMATHPDKQDRAYREIEKLSPDAPPGSDLSGLQYLRACFLETLRLRPPTPSGLPHIVEQDDFFEGYRIPKGTTVLANIWALQQNPDEYEEPEQFRPERYIQHPLGLKDGVSSEKRKSIYGFGVGRRVCPGEQFAETSILLAMSKILWAYEIVPVEKLDLTPTTGFHDGLVLSPRPFKVNFKLRSNKSEGVVRDYELSAKGAAPE